MEKSRFTVKRGKTVPIIHKFHSPIVADILVTSLLLLLHANRPALQREPRGQE